MILVAFGGVACASSAETGDYTLVDHFQSCSTSGWDEGQTRGQWSLAFDGYGNVGVGRAGDNKLL